MMFGDVQEVSTYGREVSPQANQEKLRWSDVNLHSGLRGRVYLIITFADVNRIM